jgi:hypothetical protein
LGNNSEKSLNNPTPKEVFRKSKNGGERRMDGKSKGLILLSVIVVAAVLSGILLTTQAYNSQVTTADNEQAASQTNLATVNTQATGDENYNVIPQWNCMGIGPGRQGGRGPFGMGQYGGIEVSTEFQDTAVTIAKADSDVQQLLNNGYNVTRVMPTIKTILDADGNVVTKATNATLLLEKDTSGRALVSVDLQQSKVTKIVTLTKTVIEKP